MDLDRPAEVQYWSGREAGELPARDAWPLVTDAVRRLTELLKCVGSPAAIPRVLLSHSGTRTGQQSKRESPNETDQGAPILSCLNSQAINKGPCYGLCSARVFAFFSQSTSRLKINLRTIGTVTQLYLPQTSPIVI